MGEIVDLPVNQVRIMQNMLPRFITGMDEEVVSRYAELMEDGVEFPPVKVWRNGKDGKEQWFVLDGAHRLEAAERAKKETIRCEVEEFEEKEFLLRAFAENLKHGLPLKREEKMLVVQALYQQGISLATIRKKTGIPERTLRRWLKPLRKKQREELKKKVWELRNQGLTQEEIAEKLGITHQWISKILQQTAKWPNVAKLDSPNNSEETTGNNYENSEISNSVPDSCQELPDSEFSEQTELTPEKVSSPPPKESEEEGKKEEVEEDPPWGVWEVRKFFPKIVTPDREPMIRAIELIDYNWDVRKIVRYVESRYPEVRPTEKWVRNLAAAGLMAWWKERKNEGETEDVKQKDKIIQEHLENLGMERDRFEFILWYKIRFKREFTQREVLLRWLERNHSGYHDEIIHVIREEKMIRYYISKGINP